MVSALRIVSADPLVRDRLNRLEDNTITKGVMDTIYPWWWDEREFPRRAVMTEWFYNPLKGQPRYIDVYRYRSLAASEWVAMCVMTIIEEVAQIPWEIIPKDPKLRESPPEDILADIDEATYFFNNPNDNKGETLNTLLRALIRDSLELDAATLVKGFSLNSYVQHPAGGFELKPRGQRQLSELFCRDGASFLKETDVNGIEYRYWQYSYLHPAVAPIEFDVNEIAYAMRYNRSYSVYGWAETQSAETILNCLINSAFTNASMFQEYAVPSGVVSFTGSEEDEQRLREYFRTEIKGRFHKVAILNKEAKFTPLTYTNRDLEFIKGQEWFAKIMWAIYKLTPSEVGFTDDIRATGAAMSAQGTIQKRKAILPLLRLLEQILNNQILNEISDRIVLSFKYVDKEQEALDEQMDFQRIDKFLLMPNEYRARKKLGAPLPFGDKPPQLTLAELKAQQAKPFGSSPTGQPHQNIPTGPEEGLPKIPLTAEGQAIVEGRKAWGGVPTEGYDFAEGSLGGNDLYPAPVLTWDNRTGQVKVLPQGAMTIPGRRYITRDGKIFYVPQRKPLPVKPSQPTKTIQRSPKNKGFRDTSADVLKQYLKPTREPFIGPYEGDRKPQPKPLSGVGGNPKESIRDGMMLPGENPEEIRRARDATGPKAGKPRARQSHASDQDYPMGALGYRPDEPVRDNDLGTEQTPERIARARVGMEYERPTKPFGPIHHTDTQRTGPKDSYQGGPENIGGKYKRRQGGRIRKIGHPPPGEGPQSTGKVWRGKQQRKEKVDLHRGGMGAHRWERDETNVPVATVTEESDAHIDPHYMKKPYPGRHREITEGDGYDVESRIVPTRAGTPKIIDASKPHADRQKGLARKAKKRTTQPDNAPMAPLAKPRENLDPTGGASTEQAPRLKPTPTIPRGPKYPKDVPPIQPDTGAVGAMRATAPSGAKYLLRDKRGAPPPFIPPFEPAVAQGNTDTGSLGPDHRETLGYAERDLSKVHDDVRRSMWGRKARKKQVNAYDTREEWKGGRLETRLISAPKKAQIREAARLGRKPLSSSASAKLSPLDVKMVPPIPSKAGGKRREASFLKTLIPPHDVYVEPFAGGAALFFMLDDPGRAVLNDVNPRFTKVWQWIKQATPEQVKSMMNRPWAATRERWFHVRDQYKPKTVDDEVWQLLYVTRHSFMNRGDTWRGNLGSPDRERSQNSAPNWLSRLDQYKEQLSEVKIENKDWKEIVHQYDSPNTFFYFDPPYEEKFVPDLIKTLPTLKGKWLLSFGEDERLARGLSSKGMHTFIVPVTNTINKPTGERRTMRRELIAANYPIDVPKDLVFKAAFIGPEHTHSDAFRGPVKAERSLAKRLKEILKNFLARRLTRDQALREGHKAIDDNQTRITEIARKHASRVIGKEILELAPEVSNRLETIRTQALSDFDRILEDANSSRMARTL